MRTMCISCIWHAFSHCLSSYSGYDHRSIFWDVDFDTCSLCVLHSFGDNLAKEFIEGVGVFSQKRNAMGRMQSHS